VAKRIAWGLLALLFVLVAGVVGVWSVQNGGVTTRLGLDLGTWIGAWRSAPLPVVPLLGASFGAGFFLAASLFGAWGLRNLARARRLERSAAYSTDGL
jgi:hypothetical protein